MPRQLVIIEELGTDTTVEEAAASPFGVGVIDRSGETRDERLVAAREAEAIILRLAQIDADFMDGCPRLKVIGRCGVGTDNIDLEAASVRGIQVINVPDYCVEEVATHTAALILASWRKIVTSASVAREGRWWDWDAVSPIWPLSSCTLGVVGVGRIGRQVLDMVGPWFKAVVVFDPAAEPSADFELVTDLDEVFSRADVVTLHCPSTERTRNLVNAHRLALMPAGALLVNVSRGDLVDEDALLDALNSETLGMAALDVLKNEPPSGDHALLSHPHCIVTNHMAWLSAEADGKVRTLIAKRCAQALTGGDGETVVNRRLLDAGL